MLEFKKWLEAFFNQLGPLGSDETRNTAQYNAKGVKSKYVTRDDSLPNEEDKIDPKRIFGNLKPKNMKKKMQDK